ncbi:MAG TPA: addiction module protein [Gemmataceae bacterium]|nr:addiction module protein [Gemmataceae bacterium]
MEFSSLPIDERIRLVQAIWDSIVAENGSPPLTDDEKQMLDRRLDQLDANPSNALTWNQITADIKGQK